MSITNYAALAADTSAYPSMSIWRDCDVIEMMRNPAVGYHFFDDFRKGLETGATETSNNGYFAYGDTGVTITTLETTHETCGVVEIANNDADNDEGVLATGPVGVISDTAGADRKMWFEARVKKASIADNACAMFVGLGFDYGSVINVAKTTCLVDDTGALGAFSFIGFHVDQADGDAMNFVYMAEGGAQTDAIAGVHVPVAATYVKVGFVYDPKALASERIKVYVNGVAHATKITAALIAAAAFPDAEELGLCWAAKVGAAAESAAQMDWWRFAQLAV